MFLIVPTVSHLLVMYTRESLKRLTVRYRIKETIKRSKQYDILL